MRQTAIGGKCSHHIVGTNHKHQESRGGNHRCGYHGEFEGLHHARHLIGSVVVARYGLHGLVEAYHYHHHHKHQAVNYAVGAHSQVTTVAHKSVVDEQNHQTRRHIHHKLRHAYVDSVSDNAASHLKRVAAEIYHIVLVGKQFQLPQQRDALRYDGSHRCAAYAHIQAVDKHRVEHHIHQHSHHSGIHCLMRMPRRTQHGVQAHIQVRDYIAKHYHLHIFARIHYGLLARSEKI